MAMIDYSSTRKRQQSTSKHYHYLHDKNLYKRKAIDFKLLGRKYPDTFNQFLFSANEACASASSGVADERSILCSSGEDRRRKRTLYHSTGGFDATYQHLEREGDDSAVTLDFKDINACICLTETLLSNDFSVSVSLPTNRLCPTVPNRLDYLCNLSDMFAIKMEYCSNNDGGSSSSSSSRNSGSCYNPNSASSEILVGSHLSSQPLKIALLNYPVLDIGTGASCIYPILGVQAFGWKFLASDIDADSIEVARRNVWQNPCLRNMISFAKVHHCLEMQTKISNRLISSKSKSSHDVSRGAGLGDTCVSNNVFDFNLTTTRGPIRTAIVGDLLGSNPFSTSSSSNSSSSSSSSSSSCCSVDIVQQSELHLEQWLKSRSESLGVDVSFDYPTTVDMLRDYIKANRDTPILLNAVMTNPPFYDMDEAIEENQHSICNGAENEMRTVGGEVAFVMCLIADSIVMRQSVVWYSSLLGKKASAIKLLKFLERDLEIPSVICRRMTTGRTNRWIIFWSFFRKAPQTLDNGLCVGDSLTILDLELERF